MKKIILVIMCLMLCGCSKESLTESSVSTNISSQTGNKAEAFPEASKYNSLSGTYWKKNNLRGYIVSGLNMKNALELGASNLLELESSTLSIDENGRWYSTTSYGKENIEFHIGHYKDLFVYKDKGDFLPAKYAGNNTIYGANGMEYTKTEYAKIADDDKYILYSDEALVSGMKKPVSIGGFKWYGIAYYKVYDNYEDVLIDFVENGLLSTKGEEGYIKDDSFYTSRGNKYNISLCGQIELKIDGFGNWNRVSDCY